jgi:hypothetical protein
MKIKSIKIANFEGLRTADMQLHAPITMVSGKNGTGKSSLRDAVVMALSGQPTRVSLKKDYGQLVAEGSKAGSIELHLTDGRRSETALPDGGTKFFGNQIEDADKARAGLPFVLTPASFAAAPADGRRTALYALTGCAGGTDEAQKRLLERGAAQDKIDAILPLVSVGFPEAEKHAKQRATEAKGAWRAVTGETYGDKKAEGWEAAKPQWMPKLPSCASRIWPPWIPRLPRPSRTWAHCATPSSQCRPGGADRPADRAGRQGGQHRQEAGQRRAGSGQRP